ncbi:MAG: Spy/CpxP family protein refolding chaperone [Iodobacter sp.]
MLNAMKSKFQQNRRRIAMVAVLGLSLGGIAYAAAPVVCDGPGMMMGGGMGGGMGMMGGMGDGPGRHHANPEQMQKRMQARLQKSLQEVGATEAQQSQLLKLADQASAERKAHHESMRGERAEFRKALSQPTVDAAQLETLRAARIKAMDDTSRKMTAIMLEASKILTPEQRLKLMEKMDRPGRKQR